MKLGLFIVVCFQLFNILIWCLRFNIIWGSIVKTVYIWPHCCWSNFKVFIFLSHSHAVLLIYLQIFISRPWIQHSTFQWVSLKKKREPRLMIKLNIKSYRLHWDRRYFASHTGICSKSQCKNCTLCLFSVSRLSLKHTSQGSALTISDFSIKLINGHFDVWLTLGDGALQMFLNFRQELWSEEKGNR